MSQRFDTAARGAVLIGGRDITRHVKQFSSTENIVAVDDTHLQPVGLAMNYIAGLSTNAISISGSLPVSKELVEREMQKALGLNRDPEPLLLAPWGTVPGYYGEFLQTQQTRFGSDGLTPNITTYNADFAGTGGSKSGTILHTSQGSATTTFNEVQTLTFTDADPNQSFGLRAVGSTQVFAFTTATTNAEYKAGIQALTAYSGRTVTVAGSITGTTLKNGSKTISFDGGVNVPELEIISGQVEDFTVTNGSGNYTLNGGATFTLGITQADLTTNQQAIAGQSAGAIAKGSSTAGGSGARLTGTPFASTDRGNRNGADAFDNDLQTAWVANAGDGGGNSGNEHVGLDLGTPKISDHYKIRTFENNPQHNPLFDSWKYRGSNDGATWTVLHTVNNHAPLADGTDYDFTFSNSTAYRYYDLLITGTVPNDPILGELYIYEKIGAGSASFKIYYPVTSTKGNPTKTGTGASVSRTVVGGSIATTVTVETTQPGGAFAGNLISAAFNGTWLDMQALTGQATTNDGGFAIAEVTYASSDCNATLRIQHADDSGSNAPGSASTLIAFPAVTESGAVFITIPRGTTCKRWVRMAITSGQITGSLAFTAAFSRNPNI